MTRLARYEPGYRAVRLARPDGWIDDPQFWFDWLTLVTSVGYVLGSLIGMAL